MYYSTTTEIGEYTGTSYAVGSAEHGAGAKRKAGFSKAPNLGAFLERFLYNIYFYIF